jgi:hypothetical protein
MFGVLYQQYCYYYSPSFSSGSPCKAAATTSAFSERSLKNRLGLNLLLAVLEEEKAKQIHANNRTSVSLYT